MSKQRGSFTHLRNDSAYKVMGGPNLATEIWQKACPTNWRGRLNRDFRWVLRMRSYAKQCLSYHAPGKCRR